MHIFKGRVKGIERNGMKEIVLSKLLGVDDDMPGTNPIFDNYSSNELVSPTPLL